MIVIAILAMSLTACAGQMVQPYVGYGYSSYGYQAQRPNRYGYQHQYNQRGYQHHHNYRQPYIYGQYRDPRGFSGRTNHYR